MNDFASHIHKFCYGKSDSVNAAENQSPDFQRGYQAGMNCSDDDGRVDLICDEWTRIGKPDHIPDSFAEWKRGMWAAVFQKLTAKLMS